MVCCGFEFDLWLLVVFGLTYCCLVCRLVCFCIDFGGIALVGVWGVGSFGFGGLVF